jgi:heterodisulfide reductase subunit A
MRKKTGKAMVIGAGISGIRSALDLAEFGYTVTLIDKKPNIGGVLSQLDHQFPNDGCGMCKMLPLVERDSSSQYCLRKNLFHENIDILTGVEITDIEGEPGNFQVTHKQTSSCVDHEICTGCGECIEVCPVEVPDPFNMGLSKRKAIYLPVPQSIPNSCCIDLENCSRCGECVTVCPTGAIKLPEEKRKSFQILVVDDELIVRDSLKESLEYEGFSVDMAESGKRAIEMLSEKNYHLMLTDIKMPGMDGVEVLKRAREKFPDMPVVMMTAYATVDTAVNAMKKGALDYLLKPFDPESFTPKILEIYNALDLVEDRKIEVNAIIFAMGTDYFDPLTSKNTFGYGTSPDIMTSLEFERFLSATGPTLGELLRLSDQKPVRRIAWLQCVGSRDLQTDSDFCSSICCMHALKEARLVKKRSDHKIETTIFYMDMRTFGKSFHQYHEEAHKVHGIRFERSRVHSVTTDKLTNCLEVYHVDSSGVLNKEHFDMIVLSIGQRPSKATESFAQVTGLTLNRWGFFKPEPFSTSSSEREGIFFSGSASGLKDISESIIQSGSAALLASRFIHSKGGGLTLETEIPTSSPETTSELPSVLVIVCNCNGSIVKEHDEKALMDLLIKDHVVQDAIFMKSICTAEGWVKLIETIQRFSANRILIGACLPFLHTGKIESLSSETGIHKGLIDIIDIHTIKHAIYESKDEVKTINYVHGKLKMGIARLKRIDPPVMPYLNPVQKALVIGGGVAGMTAALAIADLGFEVELIEKNESLGGNLRWLENTIEGYDIKPLLNGTLKKVTEHPLLNVHTQSIVTGSFGSVGNFFTTVHDNKNDTVKTFDHGVVIVATGGDEAKTYSYGYGSSDLILTQKQLESDLAKEIIDPSALKSVVMIQCVDSKERSKKNYCSRICCTTALKNALALKEKNPGITIYIFYRDMMTYGFLESYYTLAREKGIIFIQYNTEQKPVVTAGMETVTIKAFEPIICRDIEIVTDLVILATGVVPEPSETLAEIFGFQTDSYGFFKEAESKWRPVDSIKEGIFTCGLSHSPRNITESIASAEACAQRALRILKDSKINSGTTIARVHHSLCSLCERCIETCSYGARILDPDIDKIIINPLMCQGCGACAAICPNSASVVDGYTDQQIFDVIDSVF